MDNQNIVDRFYSRQAQKSKTKRFYCTFKATTVRLGVLDLEAPSESEAKKLVEEHIKSGQVDWKSEELADVEFLQIADLTRSHDGQARGDDATGGEAPSGGTPGQEPEVQQAQDEMNKE